MKYALPAPASFNILPTTPTPTPAPSVAGNATNQKLNLLNFASATTTPNTAPISPSVSTPTTETTTTSTTDTAASSTTTNPLYNSNIPTQQFSATVYNNMLRDLIQYYDAQFSDSDSLLQGGQIPVVISLELDGIAGIKIGNIFDIKGNINSQSSNYEILPLSYRGESLFENNTFVGKKMKFLVKSLSQQIQEGMWTTKIEGYPFFPNQISKSKSRDPQKAISNAYAKGSPWVISINNSGQIQFTSTAASLKSSEKVVNDKQKLAAFGQVSTTVPIHGRAILDTISYTEGTAGSGQNGYDVLFSYKIVPNWTPDTTQGHPNIAVPYKNTSSTAGGRYGFLYSVWTGTNGNKNIAFNKTNQDESGWKLVQQKVPGGAATILAAYNIASKGVTDVYQNPDFLKALGTSVSKGQPGYGLGLSYGWASIPDRNGVDVYNQGTKYTPQDVYTIFLKAIVANGGKATVPYSPATVSPGNPATTITIGDSVSIGIDNVYKYIGSINSPVSLSANGLSTSKLLQQLDKVTTPYKDIKNVVLSIGANDYWGLSKEKKTELALINKIKVVFPNAKLYILNGYYGGKFLPISEKDIYLSTQPPFTDNTWTLRIKQYLKVYSDNGFTIIGKLSELNGPPENGDAFYESFRTTLLSL